MHNTSHSWLSSLTNVKGRTDSIQRGGLFWYTDRSKTNKGKGCIFGLKKEAQLQSWTVLKYILLRLV